MTVMIADRLSSGIDRIRDEEDESKTGFRESRLLSVFDEIELLKHQFNPPGNSFHDLVPLELGSEKVFPREGKPKGPAKEYEALFGQFISELGKINTNSGFNFYLESMISLLEKYTWCIPSSSFKTLPDISLFDHSLSTASIAQGLFLYHAHNESTPRWKDDKSKFILMGGDLSGIQDYIFGISRKSGRGVSKIFRARSFYLQALTRSVLLEIQRRLEIFSVCRLVDSGGKFILILPAIDQILQSLSSLEEYIQLWFRNKFKGLITMNLSWQTSLRQQDFFLANFQSKIDEVNESLDESKLKKLKKTFPLKGTIIEEGYDENEGGNCVLCDRNATDTFSSKKYEEKEGVAIPVCSDCCEQIVYIGTRLPKTNYLIYGKNETVPLFNEIRMTLNEGEPANLTDVIHVESLVDNVKFSRARLARHLPRLTKEELADERWFKLFEQEEETRYLEMNLPKTFNMIAKKSKKEYKGKLLGRPLLGFLKADVDNLGLIFSLGMGNRLSVARLTSISRMLNIFFSEYLVELVKEKFPDIYVVFAGGDDLFLVGPWWQTIQFAIELRKRLSLFCAQNPDITLSGGLLVARARLPMRKAVDLVELNLEEAKKARNGSRIKDSVSFLGEVISWRDLEELLDMGYFFDKALEQKERTNFSTAFLYRLLDYHRMYRKFSREKIMRFGRYLSLAYYDIGRNIQSTRKDNQEELEKLYEIFAIGKKERHMLDMLNIPLFYALNLNREG